MSFLSNLFGKVTVAVYETALDGSIVKKVHDPKTGEMVPELEVVGFPEGNSPLAHIPIVRLKQPNKNTVNLGNYDSSQNHGDAVEKGSSSGSWDPKPDGWDGDCPIYGGSGWCE